MRILVVEDFGPIRGPIVTALRDEGWSVEIAADGHTALQQLTSAPFDLVILDIMIPGIDGLGVLREMRNADNDAHVLVVTARDAVEDRVAALNAGADDYLVKPFAIEEMIARAHALLRRKFVKKSPVVSIGPLEIRATDHSVTLDGEPVELTAREYAMLEILAFRAGELVSKEELHTSLYGGGQEATSNVVDVYVGYLRKKLEGRGHARLLHTKRGQGFVLQHRPIEVE